MIKDTKDGARKIARQAAALRNPRRFDQPKTKANVVRLLRGGCTLTEICARADMPSFVALCEWRHADPEFAAAVEQAMLDHAEFVVKDGLDLMRSEVDKEHVDTDRARTMHAFAEGSIRYAAAIAPRKFGALAKLGADGADGIALHVVTFAPAAPGASLAERAQVQIDGVHLKNSPNVVDQSPMATVEAVKIAQPRKNEKHASTNRTKARCEDAAVAAKSTRAAGNAGAGQGTRGRKGSSRVQPDRTTPCNPKRAKPRS